MSFIVDWHAFKEFGTLLKEVVVVVVVVRGCGCLRVGSTIPSLRRKAGEDTGEERGEDIDSIMEKDRSTKGETKWRNAWESKEVNYLESTICTSGNMEEEVFHKLKERVRK